MHLRAAIPGVEVTQLGRRRAQELKNAPELAVRVGDEVLVDDVEARESALPQAVAPGLLEVGNALRVRRDLRFLILVEAVRGAFVQELAHGRAFRVRSPEVDDAEFERFRDPREVVPVHGLVVMDDEPPRGHRVGAPLLQRRVEAAVEHAALVVVDPEEHAEPALPRRGVVALVVLVEGLLEGEDLRVPPQFRHGECVPERCVESTCGAARASPGRPGRARTSRGPG